MMSVAFARWVGRADMMSAAVAFATWSERVGRGGMMLVLMSPKCFFEGKIVVFGWMQRSTREICVKGRISVKRNVVESLENARCCD